MDRSSWDVKNYYGESFSHTTANRFMALCKIGVNEYTSTLIYLKACLIKNPSDKYALLNTAEVLSRLGFNKRSTLQNMSCISPKWKISFLGMARNNYIIGNEKLARQMLKIFFGISKNESIDNTIEEIKNNHQNPWKEALKDAWFYGWELYHIYERSFKIKRLGVSFSVHYWVWLLMHQDSFLIVRCWGQLKIALLKYDSAVTYAPFSTFKTPKLLYRIGFSGLILKAIL